MIKNLTKIPFCPLQDDKLLLKANDFIIVKEKLVMMAKNLLVLNFLKDMSITIYHIFFNGL